MKNTQQRDITSKLKITLQIAVVFLGLYTLDETSTHFSAGGCDGGLCGIYLFVYSIPMAITWLLMLAMIRSGFRKSKFFFFWAFLAAGGLLTLWEVGDGSSIWYLERPLPMMLGIYLMCFAIYLSATKPTKRPPKEEDLSTIDEAI